MERYRKRVIRNRRRLSLSATVGVFLKSVGGLSGSEWVRNDTHHSKAKSKELQREKQRKSRRKKWFRERERETTQRQGSDVQQQQALVPTGQLSGFVSFNGTQMKEDEEMLKSTLSTFRAKEEEREEEIGCERERVLAQLGRSEEESRRASSMFRQFGNNRSVNDGCYHDAIEWLGSDDKYRDSV